MRISGWMKRAATIVATSAAMTGLLLAVPAAKAQNPEMQQKVSDLKAAMAANKQQLARYTWMEQDVISLKGEQKKEELYNVQLGPNGKPQKTPVDPNSMNDDQRKKRGLRGRIIEKKTEEYKDYAESIKSLIQQYLPPDKDMIQQAYQQGNIMMGPMGGQPGTVKLVFSNYVKPNDSMTIVFSKTKMAIESISINSYLSDPSDAVTVSVQFAKLPDGTNHISTETINGVSKQLTIAVQNSNYQQM